MDPASLQRGTYVQLPPSEFAQALAETRRTGTFTADYHDEDGVCTFELRGDNLFLRTAGGQLKAVFDMDVSRVMHSDSPLERFIQYCRVVDVGSEQAMHFQKLLNNEALLDCVIAWTPPNERNAAFIYVTQLPAGTELTNQNVAWSIGVPFASCATSHNVMVALVRRRDVDIGRLVKNLRRARGTETLRLLQQPDMADAMITRIMRMTSSQLAEAQASHCAMPASTPAETAARSRFVQYVTPYGVTKADAAAFADALDDDDRLDATVLSTDKDGASFYVLAHGVILAQQPEPLMSNINRLPERLRAATHLMPFIMSVDLHAEAARLRRTDPFRMRNMLAAMPGKHGNETHFGSQQPVRSAIAADRVCVACGWHEPPGGAAEERKLRACGACRLVLYCCKECQTSHWKKHKPACKAARDAARTGK